MIKKVEWDLRGVIVPLITPFKDDLSVDFAGRGAGRLLHRRGRVDGLVPCGTTGESATLSHQEHAEVIASSRTHGHGCRSSPAGSNSTSEAVELTRAAIGADATLQVCPYYNKPTQAGLFNHFAPSPAVDLPLIIYNIPGRTSRNIEPKTIVRLWAEVPSVVGLKELLVRHAPDHGDPRATDPETFKIYSGEDIMTLACCATAARGPSRRWPRDRARAKGCARPCGRAISQGPGHPLPHHGHGRRPVRRAEPDPGQAGRAMVAWGCRRGRSGSRSAA